MTMSEPISLARRMQLLLNSTREPNGQPTAVTDLAAAIGVTPHTLLNIVHGRIDNPRFLTLRSLCVLYGISLDYFQLKTEEECHQYLATQHLKVDTPLVQQIQDETLTLEPKGHRTIMSMLEWIGVVLRPRTS